MLRLKNLAYVIPMLLISLGLRFAIPPSPGYGATHDDELMVNLAHQIMNGNWLGRYDTLGHLTLSKPPGYPIFLATTNFFPWPPTVTAHILLLLGIFLIARELLIMGVSQKGVALWTAFAALTPAWFWDQTSRIYRESLLLALVSLVVALSLLSSRLIRDASTNLNPAAIAKASTAVLINGGVISFFYLTKPSWHAVLLVAAGISSVFLFIGKSLSFKLRTLGVSSVLVFLLLPVFVGIKLVEQKNFENYGVKAIDSFGNGQFPRALNLIYSIEDTEDRKYVDVTAKMREKIYSVSNTAALLSPFLEANPGEGWRSQPCQSALKFCDESGPWFAWDLRDAVQNSGLGSNAYEFEQTFKQVADDIERACKAKEITCERKGIAPGLDSIDSLGRRDFIDAISLSFIISANGEIGNFPRSFATALTEDRAKVWNETVKGLPANEELNSYEPNNSVLGDTRKLLSMPFTSLWLILLMAGTVGIFIRIRSTKKRELAANLRWISLFSALGYGIYASQIALLEASSAMFMSYGGSLYLIPAIFLQMIWLSFGVLRLAVWWKESHAADVTSFDN
jgi:hypothetical protein